MVSDDIQEIAQKIHVMIEKREFIEAEYTAYKILKNTMLSADINIQQAMHLFQLWWKTSAVLSHNKKEEGDWGIQGGHLLHRILPLCGVEGMWVQSVRNFRNLIEIQGVFEPSEQIIIDVSNYIERFRDSKYNSNFEAIERLKQVQSLLEKIPCPEWTEKINQIYFELLSKVVDDYLAESNYSSSFTAIQEAVYHAKSFATPNQQIEWVKRLIIHSDDWAKIAPNEWPDIGEYLMATLTRLLADENVRNCITENVPKLLDTHGHWELSDEIWNNKIHVMEQSILFTIKRGEMTEEKKEGEKILQAQLLRLFGHEEKANTYLSLFSSFVEENENWELPTFATLTEYGEAQCKICGFVYEMQTSFAFLWQPDFEIPIVCTNCSKPVLCDWCSEQQVWVMNYSKCLEERGQLHEHHLPDLVTSELHIWRKCSMGCIPHHPVDVNQRGNMLRDQVRGLIENGEKEKAMERVQAALFHYTQTGLSPGIDWANQVIEKLL
jgi:hypothetical protein